MPRSPRIDSGGLIYHVFNRGNDRGVLFHNPQDYEAFVGYLAQAQARLPIRLISYCLMPNHWHFVLWTFRDGDLGKFMHWLTLRHSKMRRSFLGRLGEGHLYQGRYKSISIKNDPHLFTVCRYVERNPLKARLVKRAEDWFWGSLYQRRNKGWKKIVLSDPPNPFPPEWETLVNKPLFSTEEDEIKESLDE